MQQKLNYLLKEEQYEITSLCYVGNVRARINHNAYNNSIHNRR